MKTLKKFEFPAAAAQSTYDWAKILDGGIYEMLKGEDYECEDQTLRMMAYKQGRKGGKKVQVAQNADKTGLVIQATEVDDDTKERWATEDAERKAAAKAKKDAAKANGEEEETIDEPSEIEPEPTPPPAPVKPKAGKKK